LVTSQLLPVTTPSITALIEAQILEFKKKSRDNVRAQILAAKRTDHFSVNFNTFQEFEHNYFTSIKTTALVVVVAAAQGQLHSTHVCRIINQF